MGFASLWMVVAVYGYSSVAEFNFFFQMLFYIKEGTEEVMRFFHVML